MPSERDQHDREIDRLFKGLDRETEERLAREMEQTRREREEQRPQEQAQTPEIPIGAARLQGDLSPADRSVSPLAAPDQLGEDELKELKQKTEQLVERMEMLVSIVEDLPDRIATAFGVEA